ncbi:MAG TPA: chemotaxis response regulator protein-glutamate methylesterase [Gemmatimonadales bacterium]|nr:chemotaxis response regulator protein-glutamate methylesterase [Gemmatimonadales bacterium]
MRALVVDDSVVFRRVVSEALERIPGIQVVGTASNGRKAVQQVLELNPDLVTLDIEMPELDGLQVLEALRDAQCDAGVIVLSGLTARASVLTVKALERGAFDFITKPAADSIEQSKELVLKALRPRVAALSRRREIQTLLRQPAVPKPGTPKPGATAPAPQPTRRAAETAARRVLARKPDLVLVGVSTGGPNALAQLLRGLPRDIGVPILIVQHMPPMFTASLAESLAAKCAVRVREARASEAVEANTAYIAPGGRQMRIVNGGESGVIQVTDDPPENNCRPAVDYLFRSAAHHFPGRAMAVILTGMGSDGVLGLRLLKRHGCHVIAQDEASCVVYGMPRAAVEAGVVDVILPLDQIAARIAAQVRGGIP